MVSSRKARDNESALSRHGHPAGAAADDVYMLVPLLGMKIGKHTAHAKGMDIKSTNSFDYRWRVPDRTASIGIIRTRTARPRAKFSTVYQDSWSSRASSRTTIQSSHRRRGVPSFSRTWNCPAQKMTKPRR